MLELYTSLVRPELEYRVQYWFPHYRRAVITLEGVQTISTRMLPRLERFNYEVRLQRLGLSS